MRNSVGSASRVSHDLLEGIRLKNWRSSGKLVPSTDEMVSTGQMFDLPKERT